jgi:hypothetical protein
MVVSVFLASMQLQYDRITCESSAWIKMGIRLTVSLLGLTR